MIPIRCFTCNKCIANKWELYKSKIESGMSPNEVFKYIGFNRYCCKRMFLTHIDIVDKLLLYSHN